jgi:membrane-associated phospholipid phosphatase
MRRNSSHWLRLTVVVTMVVCAASAILAQTPTQSPSPNAQPAKSLESEFLKNILRDQKAIWTAPFHLERKDAKWLVPSGIGLMTLFTTDRITGDEIGEPNDQLTASRVISYGGSIYVLGPTVAAFYLVGREKNDARARETGLLSAEAMVDSLIVSSALKGITQRARPADGNERSEFFDGGNSFPSGHSIQAWSVATVIANEYHTHRMVPILAYGIASAVSIARVTDHKHYISDALVGSGLGYGIGKYVYSAHHRRLPGSIDDDKGPEQSHWPLITANWDRHAHEYGVRLTWGF